MIPLRLVIDTNIVVSAALKSHGLQRTVLTLALTKPARWFVSEPILTEYRLVLGRPELQIRRGLQRQLLDLIERRSHVVKPTSTLHVATDSDDNRFLECADAARADYLLTGNLRHFPKYWKRTKIITSRQFVEIVGPHLIP
jgi:putative PIN family toxin of toxin-antitoxin system